MKKIIDIPQKEKAEDLIGKRFENGTLVACNGWRREDLETVTFWLTNILRYLPKNRMAELHKQIGDRLPPPEV